MFNCGIVGSILLNDLFSYFLYVWLYIENNIFLKVLSFFFVGCVFLEIWFVDVFFVLVKWFFFFWFLGNFLLRDVWKFL